MLLTDITRKQAFLTHLSVSLLIFVVMSYLIYYNWYPSYYFHMDGGYRGVATIFFVDVVLGPGLMLLLFKPGKPGLKFDIAAVLIFQLVALTWGTMQVYGNRPALTVFYDGLFTCLDQTNIKNVNLDKLDIESKDNVVLAVLHRPETYDEYLEYSRSSFLKGSSVIYEYGELFQPVNQSTIDHILEFKLDVDKQIASNESYKAVYGEVWDKYKHLYDPSSTKRFYPLVCRYEHGLAVFDPEAGAIDEVLPLYIDEAESNVPLKVIVDIADETAEQ